MSEDFERYNQGVPIDPKYPIFLEPKRPPVTHGGAFTEDEIAYDWRRRFNIATGGEVPQSQDDPGTERHSDTPNIEDNPGIVGDPNGWPNEPPRNKREHAKGGDCGCNVTVNCCPGCGVPERQAEDCGCLSTKNLSPQAIPLDLHPRRVISSQDLKLTLFRSDALTLFPPPDPELPHEPPDWIKALGRQGTPRKSAELEAKQELPLSLPRPHPSQSRPPYPWKFSVFDGVRLEPLSPAFSFEVWKHGCIMTLQVFWCIVGETIYYYVESFDWSKRWGSECKHVWREHGFKDRPPTEWERRVRAKLAGLELSDAYVAPPPEWEAFIRARQKARLPLYFKRIEPSFCHSSQTSRLSNPAACIYSYITKPGDYFRIGNPLLEPLHIAVGPPTGQDLTLAYSLFGLPVPFPSKGKAIDSSLACPGASRVCAP